MNNTKLLIRSMIMEAIAAKTQCIMIMKGGGVDMYNYQDRIGVHCRLALYTSNYEDISGKMGLRWIYMPYKEEEFEGGSLFIDWEELDNFSIRENGGRVLIHLGSLTINFLESIKKADS